jgi:hypothetical protein
LFTNTLIQYGHVALWPEGGQVEPETQDRKVSLNMNGNKRN